MANWFNTCPHSFTGIVHFFDAFDGNQLTAVAIPNTVSSIESGAFMNNRIASLTIFNG